jgi:hypothetical protein
MRPAAAIAAAQYHGRGFRIATCSRERDDATLPKIWTHFAWSRSRNANRGGFNEQAGCRQQILSRQTRRHGREGAAADSQEVTAMSSPEELTFVVGRWLRPIVVVLDVVRRFGLRTTSSREQRSTALNQ